MATMNSFFPISEISPYHKGWTLKARITSRTQVRTLTTKNGCSVKVFNADLIDASQFEIKCSFFREAAERLHDKLKQGKCYTFANGTARAANQLYNSTKHKYELIFEKECIVQEVPDDPTIPLQVQGLKVNISSIDSLSTRNLPSKVDICGIVLNFQPATILTAKDGQELAKREITVLDDSCASIMIALWGEMARQPDASFCNNPVVVMKGVLVKEWDSSRAGTMLQEGKMILGPAVPEAHRVLRWWDAGGKQQPIVALSKTWSPLGGTTTHHSGTLSELREAKNNFWSSGTKQFVFTIFCRLHSISTRRQGMPVPLYYRACQEVNEQKNIVCSKRVDENDFCPACNRTVKTKTKIQVRAHFSDPTDSQWIGTFDDPVQEILGIDAEEVANIEMGDGGRNALETFIHERCFEKPLQIMVRVKADACNGEQRLAQACYDAVPVDRGERAREMLQEISQMLAE